MTTFKEINQQNSAYWEKRNRHLEKIMLNEAVLKITLKNSMSPGEVNLPLRDQSPFEVHLESAYQIYLECSSYFSKLGGRAMKEDPLQKYILELVQTRPRITSTQLLKVLVNEVRCGLIEEVDKDDEGLIYFKNGKGKRNDAEISGLKDRLSRAKKKINSH